jgi:PadR family transcriptional regulator PadR
MFDRTQLLKGLLEGCVLKIISLGETYGYEITSELNKAGFTDINEGSVYPVLLRLEKKGILESVKKKSSLGPSRKYFRLTQEGDKYLKSFIHLWSEISSVVDGILER